MRLFIYIAIIASTGCSTWPDEGQGGWAEQYERINNQLREDKGNMQYHIVNSEYEHVSLKLELLKSRGIKDCMPAKLYQAELLINRIKRAINAQMYEDAALDLRVLYFQVKQLSNHFELITSKTQCGTSLDTKDSGLFERITTLLNSDNQFAFAKFEITPKYRTRIAQAAELLKLVPNNKVLLVGHTDRVGTEAANFELAFKRAEQVKHWLMLYGVPDQQLVTIAQGSESPYSKHEGVNPINTHSDRRVNAYLLTQNADASHQQMSKVKPLSEWTNALESEEEL